MKKYGKIILISLSVIVVIIGLVITVTANSTEEYKANSVTKPKINNVIYSVLAEGKAQIEENIKIKEEESRKAEEASLAIEEAELESHMYDGLDIRNLDSGDIFYKFKYGEINPDAPNRHLCEECFYKMQEAAVQYQEYLELSKELEAERESTEQALAEFEAAKPYAHYCWDEGNCTDGYGNDLGYICENSPQNNQ